MTSFNCGAITDACRTARCCRSPRSYSRSADPGQIVAGRQAGLSGANSGAAITSSPTA
jgi:hypothetical protein